MTPIRAFRFPITAIKPPHPFTTTRLITTTPHLQARMGSNPQANQPDSINANVRKDTPNTDIQSSASSDENKSGDDHPAKQPDTQAEPDRKTGIGGATEVKGGKDGLKERGDR